MSVTMHAHAELTCVIIRKWLIHSPDKKATADGVSEEPHTVPHRVIETSDPQRRFAISIGDRLIHRVRETT